MKLPPIEPLAPPVKDRPKCYGCRRPLKPDIASTWGQVPHPDGSSALIPGVTARAWRGEYQGFPYRSARPEFCGLNCAGRFAVAAINELKTRRSHCQECGAKLTPRKATS